MKMGELYPELFKEIKRTLKRRQKAIEIEIAYRQHERAQGERPRGSFVKAVKRIEGQMEDVA